MSDDINTVKGQKQTTSSQHKPAKRSENKLLRNTSAWHFYIRTSVSAVSATVAWFVRLDHVTSFSSVHISNDPWLLITGLPLFLSWADFVTYQLLQTRNTPQELIIPSQSDRSQIFAITHFQASNINLSFWCSLLV